MSLDKLTLLSHKFNSPPLSQTQARNSQPMLKASYTKASYTAHTHTHTHTHTGARLAGSAVDAEDSWRTKPLTH
jgi:hypothetical protein